MERNHHPARYVVWLLVLALTALAVPGAVAAQETRGRITGRGSDATKGAIPGATVTVTEPARNTTVTVTTNEQGLFQVNFLLPGTYKLTVELTGFKTYVQENVVLQMTETRDLPIVLEVGALSESVSVTAQVSERDERRRTLKERCEMVAELVSGDRPAVVWCHLNAEGDVLERVIPDCLQVSGNDSEEAKVRAYTRLSPGRSPRACYQAQDRGVGIKLAALLPCGHVSQPQL